MSTTLTVAIPNYNHGHLLERCLSAVMSQDRLPDELIVYDDASTDNSLEILKELQTRWPLLQIIEGKENIGVVKGIALLTKQAENKWIHCLAVDDIPLAGFYRLAMREAEKYPQAAICFGGYIGVEAKNGDRWQEDADRWIDKGYVSPQDMVWKLFDKAPALFSLGYTNIWNREKYLTVGNMHHEIESYTDTLYFRLLTAQFGGIYLGSPPLVCVNVDAHTYGGKCTQDKHEYFKILCKAADIWGKNYPTIYTDAFLQKWKRKAKAELGLQRTSFFSFAKRSVPWLLKKVSCKVERILGR